MCTRITCIMPVKKQPPMPLLKRSFAVLLSMSLLCVWSCKQTGKGSPSEMKLEHLPLNVADTTSVLFVPDSIIPIYGFNFMIEGDFDGDGGKESLIERYYSSVTKMETNKFYKGLDSYEQLVEYTVAKKPISFAVCTNNTIDTLRFGNNYQLFGLAYLKNEGDLNGDGTDEVSYVINRADWSNINTWNIATYTKGSWEEFYSFPIYDWQIPELPIRPEVRLSVTAEEARENAVADSIYRVRRTELSLFGGLVKKINNQKLSIIGINEDAELDTMIVQINPFMKRTNR